MTRVLARLRDHLRLLAAGTRVREVEARERLVGAATLADAARVLVDRATNAVGVEFGAVMLVADDASSAWAVAARDRGVDVDWLDEMRVDLVNEPSGVASAYHDASPFAVFDARASSRVNPRLVERTGTRSVAYVPMIAEQRVFAVLVLASVGRQRTFSADDLSRLQALAVESAPVLHSMRRRLPTDDPARSEVLARIAQQVRAETDVDEILRTAVTEVARALGVERCFVRLGDEDPSMPVRAEWVAEGRPPIGDRAARLGVSSLVARTRRTITLGDVATAPELADDPLGGRRALLEVGTRAVLGVPISVFGRLLGVLAVHRSTPGDWSAPDVSFAEAVARELGFALHTVRLLADSERRLERQSSLLQATQSLTSELELDRLLERIVNEVVALVGADAADCWLFDEERRLLRCRAVQGLPATEVGRAIEPDGLIAAAIETRRPVLERDFARSDPPPSESYREFEEAMDAPIVVLDEVRGVLGMCSRAPGRFDEQDLELIEAFAAVASLALRNAEAFAERTRQARIQRGFYRIASVLGDPLSLSATLDAVSHAAREAFGGRSVAVIAARGDRLELAGRHDVPDALADAVSGGLREAGDLIRHAVAERRVVASSRVADDARVSPAWRDLASEWSFESMLVVPIELPSDATALVVVFFEERRRLGADDLELAGHLAVAARAAVERSELFEAERTSRSLAQQLARTGRVLSTELDPAAVLDHVVDQAPELLGADACAVRLLEGDALVVAAASGPGTAAALGTRTEPAGWLSGEVAQSRRALALDDAASDPMLAALDPIVAHGHAAFLGVPLVGSEGALHGVLAVYGTRPRAWRREEVEALLALAVTTASALSNAELYQRVALEKERSAAILENVADGIVAVDREGNVVLWNRAAERVTGIPTTEALGHPPQRLVGRPLAGSALLPIQTPGGEIWLSITEAVMRDPAGAVSGRIFAFRDVSAERLVEEMKSEFVSTVSHELRGPLTSIYGFAETLLREDVPFIDEERRVFLRYITTESERLTTIVDALLNVARVDSGDLQVTLAPTDVGSLVADVVSTVEQGAGVNGHDFVVDLPPEPIAAEADADKLRQVLGHLVDNAVRYSPNGGRVVVAARLKSDTVEFQVADEGIGIPEGERDRIFKKFYRASADRGGTGLGLFIAQGLVSAMGGRIRVESAEGEGSRFAFELPAARVEAFESGPQ